MSERLMKKPNGISDAGDRCVRNCGAIIFLRKLTPQLDKVRRAFLVFLVSDFDGLVRLGGESAEKTGIFENRGQELLRKGFRPYERPANRNNADRSVRTPNATLQQSPDTRDQLN